MARRDRLQIVKRGGFSGRGIAFELRERVATLTLDRPGDANRVTHEMAAALIEACEAAEDSDARAVILRGSGRWFCGGLAAGVLPADLHGRRNPVEALAGITKPVVAVLAGAAVGMGAEMALAADLRVAARPATLDFGGPEKDGLPSFGATQRLPRLVGRALALEILLLGAPVGASRAAKIGLVSRVVPRAELERAVGELTAALSARGPVAMALAKEAVLRSGDLALADGLRLEEDLYVLLQTTADRVEGVRSFLRNRQPRFHGR